MKFSSRLFFSACRFLGIVVLGSTFSLAVQLDVHRMAGAALLPANADVLAREVAALPGRPAVLIAPVVALPAVAPVIGGRYAKEMRRLAVKYDVRKIGEREVGKGMNFYSQERETRMGDELAARMNAMLKLVDDPVVLEFVNRVMQNVVRNSDVKAELTIKVIDSDDINAFALPGGHLYVNSGVLLAAENEAELAGVLAHEVAHIAARHVTRNMSKRDLLDLCLLPTALVASPAVMVVREVAVMTMPMQFMKFSRDAEREADLLGIEYAYAAGYDPAAAVSFFEKAATKEKRQKGFFSQAYATHPMSGERVERAQAEMQWLLPVRESYVVTTSEFGEVKARLERIKAGLPAEPVLHHPARRRLPKTGEGGSTAKENDAPPVLRRGKPDAHSVN